MLTRIAAVCGLLVLAPVSAEYLYGYDDSTGDLTELLGGLLIFIPLYGAAAVIIREAARRAGRGWPTILLLGTAFGVLQAGLIDHSMFNLNYRGIEYWDDIFAPTVVPGLGVSLALAVQFTVGHLVWSFAVPIAIVESFVPARRTTPWLGKPGFGVVSVAYLLAAAVVFNWHVRTEAFLPSIAQFVGAGVVVVALIVGAFVVGRTCHRTDGTSAAAAAVSPWLVGVTSFGILLRLPDWLLGAWMALGANLALYVLLGVLIVRWSRSAGWSQLHRLAAAAGALLANVLPAFATEPIGDVSMAAKLVHNTVALCAVMALLLGAGARVRHDRATTGK